MLEEKHEIIWAEGAVRSRIRVDDVLVKARLSIDLNNNLKTAVFDVSDLGVVRQCVVVAAVPTRTFLFLTPFVAYVSVDGKEIPIEQGEFPK